MKFLCLCSPGLLLLALICFSCQNKNLSPEYISVKPRIETFTSKKPTLERKDDSVVFRSKIMNLGSCRKDTTIILSYKLLNQSKRPVLIKVINGSCGCLTFDYKKNEIFPGEESSINVTFKSGSIEGFFKKEVYVHLTTGRMVTLCFYVSVV